MGLMSGSPDTQRRSRARVLLIILVALGAVLLLTSCAAGPNAEVDTGEDPAGFLLGLWHGFIILVTFVISLFSDNVSVYEVANNGNWYDFGFILGILISIGGSGGGASRSRKRG